MNSYMICYDLRNESGSHDYQPLWDELNELDGHRTQESVWLVAVDATAKKVLNHLKQFVDGDDRLWVNELVKNRHFTNALRGTNDWLKNNPPRR
jgi:hypothetical protein